ncbi:unnamed protein product [Cyprideis torosa]|uniref:non-specific serine/threonine protein kinase n=1 Tax=Cyprideis torosa TaxID=163714 RepID=A0A7R8ZHJ7_9CRUS|nr:unnamed protein product [Cyprideis torosa]CAG0883911.1 unnamed protein product [Cyprideis torosa]
MGPKKTAYKRAPRLPAGMLISNETVSTAKDVFELDHVIGSGGFGDIYACTKVGFSTIPLAVKIEPFDNGPLFTEMHMMLRLSSKAEREAFLQQKKISSINIPFLEGFGKFEHESQSFRFLVLPRYDVDLEKLMPLCPGKILPVATSLNIGIQMVNALEFIHSKGLVHSDIKGSNIMISKDEPDQAFLLDYGLVYRYSFGDKPKSYNPDARFAHDGTKEFTSRDLHVGCHTRRSDLEILGYNLLYWSSGTLPWWGLDDVKEIHSRKEHYLKDLKKLSHKCFPVGSREEKDASVIFVYFKDILKLKAEEEPDYETLRNILRTGIRAVKGKEGCLGLSDIIQKAKTQKRPSEDGGSADVPPPVKKRRAAGGKKNAPAAEASGKKKPAAGRGRGGRSGQRNSNEENQAVRATPPITPRGRASVSPPTPKIPAVASPVRRRTELSPLETVNVEEVYDGGPLPEAVAHWMETKKKSDSKRKRTPSVSPVKKHSRTPAVSPVRNPKRQSFRLPDGSIPTTSMRQLLIKRAEREAAKGAKKQKAKRTPKTQLPPEDETESDDETFVTACSSPPPAAAGGRLTRARGAAERRVEDVLARKKKARAAEFLRRRSSVVPPPP